MATDSSTIYVVTGANRGIGLGLVTALLSRPHTVVIGTVRSAEAHKQLADATEEFTGSKTAHMLTVWTYTSFMIGFLIPRLPDFQLRHPNIKVRLISATDSTDFNRDQVDVRLRYGHGHWPGFDSTLLFREELRPVCSPRLVEANGGPLTVDDLKQQILLHYDGRRHDWADWLAAAGHADLAPRDNLVFDELSVANQAAIAGVGLAMVQKAYFQTELANGQLVAPFDTVLRRDRGYYLTVSRERRNAEHVTIFRDWLIEQLAGQQEPYEESYPVLRAVNG